MLNKLLLKAVLFLCLCIMIPASLQATTNHKTDFGMLLFMQSTSESAAAATPTYVINYYERVNNQEISEVKSDGNCQLMKELFKNDHPCNDCETSVTWFQQHHNRYMQIGQNESVLIVYVNWLPTWNMISKNLKQKQDITSEKKNDQPKNCNITIPLESVFLGLWMNKPPVLSDIGSYFDKQREWLQDQNQLHKKVSDYINQEDQPFKQIDLTLKFVGYGLLICAVIVILIFLVFLFFFLRQKRKDVTKHKGQPDKHDNLEKDLHKMNQFKRKQGEVVQPTQDNISQMKQQLEIQIKTSEDSIIKQIEPLTEQLNELIKKSNTTIATMDECLKVGGDKKAGLPTLYSYIMKIYKLLQNSSPAETVNAKPKREYGF